MIVLGLVLLLLGLLVGPPILTTIGIVLIVVGLIVGGSAGDAIVYFACASIVGAALVLATGGAKYFRPAFVQGITPLLALVLAAVL